MLNARLAAAESMTHDVIRDLLGVKLDMTNYAVSSEHQDIFTKEKLIKTVCLHIVPFFFLAYPELDRRASRSKIIGRSSGSNGAVYCKGDHLNVKFTILTWLQILSLYFCS